jgi:hypothetical protein
MDAYLWDGSETLPDASSYDREYITEVVNRGWAPALDSLMVGFCDIDEYGGAGTEPNPLIQAIGVVKSVVRVASGRQRVRLEPLLMFDPVAWVDFVEHARSLGEQNTLPVLPLELRPSKLTTKQTRSLLEFLSQNPKVLAWLDALDPQSETSAEVLEIFNESRDAVGLALEISSLGGLPPSPFKSKATGTDTTDILASIIKDAHLADSEEDLIPMDLLRFEEDTEIEQIAGHAAVLRGNNYELVVFNVNKKPMEVVLGVDLIYWDTVLNTFTLVQYKRLDPEVVAAGHTEWLYKSESELRKQLALMTTPSEDLSTAANWRMASPYWFKFVRRDAAQGESAKLLRGMYVSADYLRLALDDGFLKSGPRGGFRLGYGNTKYISRASFVELVRVGLIGTRSIMSSDMSAVIGDLTKDGRSAIVAMKRRWGSPEDDDQDTDSLFERDQNSNATDRVMGFEDLLEELEISTENGNPPTA